MPPSTYSNGATVSGSGLAEQSDDGSDTDDDIVVTNPLPGGTGDVDGDGDTDLADARIILQILLGLVEPTSDQLAQGDVAGDIDETDLEIVSTCVSCGCGGP